MISGPEAIFISPFCRRCYKAIPCDDAPWCAMRNKSCKEAIHECLKEHEEWWNE